MLNYKKVEKKLFILFICLGLPIIILNGCAGCSESGLRHRAAQHLSDDQNQRGTSYQRIQPGNQNRSEVQPSEAEGLSLIDLFSKHKSSIFMVFTEDAENIYQGSGFFIHPDGIAVSNYHIFEGTIVGNELIITESGNDFKVERVLERNEELDYIIFKVGGVRNVNFLPIARNSPQIGESVFAITNPRGLNHTLSTGIVSGFRGENHLIQTSAEITHGSSGGALMNMRGEAIGITTGGFDEANLNFAVNIKKLRLERYLR